MSNRHANLREEIEDGVECYDDNYGDYYDEGYGE